MLTVNSQTENEIRKESRHFSARLVFGTKKYDEIDSFTYTSHYSPQKFTVGCVPSASVQCDIRGLTASLPSNLKGQVFRLEISVGEETENDKPEWLSLGEFKITEASVKDGVFSITAYDKSNFIKGDYKSNLTGNQTIADIFDDVCSKIKESSQGFTATNADGKGYVKDTVSSPYTLNVESLKGYPLKDVLSYIAAMFARNLTVNRQGLFELKAYRKPNYDLLNDDRIETPELNDSDSTFGYLSAAVDSDTILTSGKTTGSGFLFSCPIMTQKRLDYLQGLLSDDNHSVHTFRPGKVVQLLGDPRIEVGDVLPLNPVYNAEGNVVSADCYIPVMSLVMKYDGGLMNEITAYDFEEDTSLSAAQRIDFAEKSAKRVTKYATAAAEFSGIIAGGLGLYKTEMTDESGAVKTYLHDRPTLEESTYIITFNSQGFASASNGDGTPCWNNGNPKWTDGVSRGGNAVMKTIAANKITADLIYVTDLSALGATIGGFSINDYYIVTKDTTWGNEGSLLLCPGGSKEEYPKSIGGSKSLSGWVITAGANFGVTKSGQVYASDVYLTGCITATSGTVGGWKIDSSVLYVPKTVKTVTVEGEEKVVVDRYGTGMAATSSSNAVAFWAGYHARKDSPFSINDGITDSTKKLNWEDYTDFYVTNTGFLHAKNADINGKITAESGTIGGFDIKSFYIVTKDTTWGNSGSLLLCPGGSTTKKEIGGSDSINGWVITAGSKFGVTTDGILYADSSRFTGNVICWDGKHQERVGMSNGAIAFGWANATDTELYVRGAIGPIGTTNADNGIYIESKSLGLGVKIELTDQIKFYIGSLNVLNIFESGGKIYLDAKSVICNVGLVAEHLRT